MTKLLKKEFRLSMHPIVLPMLLLSAMVLIPNYPFVVIFFYTGMSLFFTCLLGRENRDIAYSLSLPVEKRDIVRARILLAVLIELAQLALMIPFVLLSQRINPAGNLAGMDANLALFAVGFIAYGLFNLVFFTSYYRNVTKVGAAFVKASVVLGLYMVTDIVSTYAVPIVRDRLDTAGGMYTAEKLIAVLAAAALYAGLTLLSCRMSERSFEKQDLN